MTQLYQSRILGIIIILCLLVGTQQSVVYGATAANDNKENDNNINLLQNDKTVSTANNDNPHHHHFKHHISLDNSNRRLLGDGTSLPASSTALDEEQDIHQDTQSDEPMPIKGSVSGKKHQVQSSLSSIVANSNSRILLPEDDSQQILVSRGGKRLLRKKRIRAQIRNNNSWGRGGSNNWNNRRGKGRKSSKGYGKGRKWGKSSKGWGKSSKGRGWRNSNWYDDDWFNEPKWNDDWDKPKDKWNDDWKNVDWIEAPKWESSSWSADWKRKEIVHVEPEHDICLQNPKGKSLFCVGVSFFVHIICSYTQSTLSLPIPVLIHPTLLIHKTNEYR